MNKCKKCDSKLVIIPPSYQMRNPEKKAKDFYCPKCNKYFDKDEIKIEPNYVTLCPYCKEYLADCGYIHCYHCGKKLKKSLLKEKI